MSEEIPSIGASNHAILSALRSLLDGESDALANLANAASLLYHSLSDINWVGFYIRRGDELVLGPFHGKPACVRIAVGAGVCGNAVTAGTLFSVPDVRQFPGHIACDPESRSELVVPIKRSGIVIAVLDIDSPVVDRFGIGEEELASEIARIIERYPMDWSSLGLS
ncbi:MAG: GAF domain-containing protein [Chlorobi bacterium]|nr:GAF domain-containing protein [Chlorobiota bacterium]